MIGIAIVIFSWVEIKVIWTGEHLGSLSMRTFRK